AKFSTSRRIRALCIRSWIGARAGSANGPFFAHTLITLRTAMSTEAIALPKQLKHMPDHARLWVYKAPRDLGQAEQKLVREKGQAFTGSWAAHGQPLDACVDVLAGRFVVVAVDEEQAMASGCSIDRSVAFIKELEHDL